MFSGSCDISFKIFSFYFLNIVSIINASNLVVD